jgi:hypothetical protein
LNPILGSVLFHAIPLWSALEVNHSLSNVSTPYTLPAHLSLRSCLGYWISCVVVKYLCSSHLILLNNGPKVQE